MPKPKCFRTDWRRGEGAATDMAAPSGIAGSTRANHAAAAAFFVRGDGIFPGSDTSGAKS